MTQFRNTIFSNEEPPSPIEKEEMLKTLQTAVEIIQALPVYTPCSGCEFGFSGNGEYCEFYGQNIPADWREKGCQSWEQSIPF